jgi:cytochrome c-type biogenesis protein CcmH/NrfG
MGRLTVTLVEAIRRTGDLSSIPASALAGSPSQQAADGDRLIADPVADRVDALTYRVRDATLVATTSLLEALLEQRNGVDAETQLQLGVLRAQIGDVVGAVDALEHAIQQFGANSTGEARARLHLGRVLLDSGRDRARAVSECRLATQRDPQLVEAWYWLGRAIAELIERETAAEATDALRTYLRRGAPIGRRSEVAHRLNAMSTTAVTTI